MKLFETRERSVDQKKYWVRNENHPLCEIAGGWVQACHADSEILPNDWIYGQCADIWGTIEEYAGWAESVDDLREQVERSAGESYIYYTDINTISELGTHHYSTLVDHIKDIGYLPSFDDDTSEAQRILNNLNCILMHFASTVPDEMLEWAINENANKENK